MSEFIEPIEWFIDKPTFHCSTCGYKGTWYRPAFGGYYQSWRCGYACYNCGQPMWRVRVNWDGSSFCELAVRVIEHFKGQVSDITCSNKNNYLSTTIAKEFYQ